MADGVAGQGTMQDDPDSANSSEIRVKLIFKGGDQPRAIEDEMLPRFPGGAPRWGRCRFLFDLEERDYDWLVVYDDLPPRGAGRPGRGEEVLACPPEHSLLITTEPGPIKHYGSGFLAQFGHVLTSQEPWRIHHPHAHFSQPGLVWFYGRRTERGHWDQMRAHPPLAKSQHLSTVCSSKRHGHTLHRQRYDFVQALARKVPELEVFGRGVQPIGDKAEALDAFRYHLAIENHIAPHHWTEKLADAFLGHCLPFYIGCPNAADYFPEESFVPLDLADVDAAAGIISETMRHDGYGRRLAAIAEARRRVLDDYGLFATVRRWVEALHDPAAAAPADSRASLLSRRAWRVARPGNLLRFLGEELAIATRQVLRKRMGS